MKVQRIRSPETDEVAWIVLDDGHLPIEPITAYLAFLENLGRSPHTRRAIAHHLKLFWEFLRDEQINWTEVDIARLASFISWLRRPASAVLSIAPQEAKRTNATIDQMLASVHGFYDFHMRLGAVAEQPLYQFLTHTPRRYKPFLYGIAKMKPIQTRVVKVKRERRRVKTLTIAQVDQLIAACSHIRDKFLLTLLSQTGMRIGQVLGLRHSDISVEDNEIHIVPREHNVNGARAKSRHAYVIPDVAASVMQFYTEYLIEDLGALESDHLPDYVFVNLWEGERGHPMTYDAVMSLIRRLRKRTGIPVTPHQFRHTRATSWLRDDQLSLESTSARLGHASIETTRSTYDHRNMDDVKKELQAARARREGGRASMDSEPIWWSAEKQQHLADQLTGFWAEETWLFTSKQGETYQMSFPLPAPALQAEIKYALRTKFESGRWKTNGNLSSMCHDVKAILQWLNQLPLIADSLMQKPCDHWVMSLRSYLVQTGQYRRVKSKYLLASQTYVEQWVEDKCICLLRQIYAIVADAYDDREETEKDIWKPSRLGLTINPSRPEPLLNFTLIAQPWLCQLAKVFMKYNMSVRSPADCQAKVQMLREFSRFLTAQHPALCIAEMNRALIVSFISYLKAQGKTSHRVMIILVHLRTFLEGCAYHLNVAGLTKERLILEGDFPKLPHGQPRDLPAEVLAQLREHLETLPTTALRMVVILLEVGLRISEVCTLELSCLVHDDRNEWYLRFYQWKAKQEHIVPLLDEAVVATIQAQQQAIRERWGDTCQYLFPSPLSHLLPFKAGTFTRILNEWACDKQICDQTGDLYHFQSHQFRHTVGMQLINEDVPLDVISRLFGHGSLFMTQRYAHKRAAKLRAELERAARKRKTVNAAGQVVTGDPHANDPDAQLLRKGIRGQTLPVGGCGRLIVLGGCPHANTCVTCTYWLTSTDDLPALKSFHQRAVRLQQRATEVGNQLVMQQQDRIIPSLALRIKSLEDPSPNGGLSVDELLAQLRCEVAEAESGLDEARVAGLVLATKHLERTIAELKMRMTALEETT